MAAAVLAAGSAAFPAAAQERAAAGDGPPGIEGAQGQTEIRTRLLSKASDWLLQHPDPRYRSAGLLHIAGGDPGAGPKDRSAGPTDGEHEMHADSWVHRFERTIQNARDGAALAWLAHACSKAGLESACIDAGLDQAIVARDRANLFSRLALSPEQNADRLASLILDAQTAEMYSISQVEVWFDAFSAADTASQLEAHERLVGAFGQVMASATPADQALADACLADLGVGSRLDAACSRLLNGMADHGESARERIVAIGILERRARARGKADRAEQLAVEKRRIEQLLHCSGREIEPVISSGGAGAISEFLTTIVEHGEVEGLQRVAAAHGIDCSGSGTELTFVDPLLTDKLGEIERTIDRLWPSAGQWLLDHSDPRMSAAGLLYQLSEMDRIGQHIASLERDAMEPGARFDPMLARSMESARSENIALAAHRLEGLREIEPAAVLADLEAAIGSTTDGAALAWLAAACRGAGIEQFCIEAGLDDAIVRRDSANPFSRGALYRNADTERMETLIVEARTAATYETRLLSVWYEALGAVDTNSELNDYGRMLGGYRAFLSYDIPFVVLDALGAACGTSARPDTALEAACDRLLDQMAEDGRTFLAQIAPISIRSRRAEARGHVELAAQLDAEKTRLNDRQIFQGQAVYEMFDPWNDASVSAFVALLAEHGEVEAHRRLAAVRVANRSD